MANLQLVNDMYGDPMEVTVEEFVKTCLEVFGEAPRLRHVVWDGCDVYIDEDTQELVLSNHPKHTMVLAR